MKKNLILLILLLISMFIIGGCGEQIEDKYTPLEKLTITEGQAAVGGLIYVASEKGYFLEEGLNVTLQHYSSGKDGLNAVLEGEVDLGQAANTPIAFGILNGKDITVISTIGTSTKAIAIIALKDKGINSPSDLKDKKVGVTSGTNGEFFLNLFLVVNGLTKNDLEIINVAPSDMYDAITEGRVDAVSTWEPHLKNIQSEFGTRAITFYDGEIYALTWNLIGHSDFVNNNPDKIIKVNKALVKAEAFVNNNPSETISIIAKSIEMNEEEFKTQRDSFNFEIALKQTLLLNLEDQSRWAINNGLTEATKVPNYLNYIYINALEEVKPEAVMIIR
jgi:ABC-type nitrate/sulfonate/bicarbonate transport system substrate-binding protein